MLQQTQIAAALPFYQSFLERFPTVGHLARSTEASVLAAWSGLGYYRRARQLRAAARIVVDHHGGKVPADAASFGNLPGVGRYTQGAVLSIAFGKPLPVLDGNVARVLSRVFARPWAVRDPRGAAALWALADTLVPRRRAGDWNQAVMELGATVCTPRVPRCGTCPIAATCTARARGQVHRFPPVVPRRTTVRLHRSVAVVRHGRRWLLVPRSGALLDGLWEPPDCELFAELGIEADLIASGHRITHRITHREIVVDLWTGRARAVTRRANAPRFRWDDPARPAVALTGLARKLARLLAEQQATPVA